MSAVIHPVAPEGSVPSPVRRAAPWFGLAASVLAALWVGSQSPADDDAVAQPVARSVGTPRAQAVPAARQTPRADAVTSAWPQPPSARRLAWGDRAKAPAWGLPPPLSPPPMRAVQAPVVVPASTEPPPPPPAPPFPYQIVGRLEEGGSARAMLTGALRTLAVQAGDQIDGQWRVDAVQPNGLGLTWLPTGQRLTVPFTGSSRAS